MTFQDILAAEIEKLAREEEVDNINADLLLRCSRELRVWQQVERFLDNLDPEIEEGGNWGESVRYITEYIEALKEETRFI